MNHKLKKKYYLSPSNNQGWYIFFILLGVTLLIPSYDFGFDGYFIQQLAKGMFSHSSNVHPPFDVAFFLFPGLQRLYSWHPDFPWITACQRGLWLLAFSSFSLALLSQQTRWYPLLVIWASMLPFWIYASVVQNGFWLAVAGGYLFMFLPKFSVRILGLLFFLLGILWRDLSVLLALVSLGAAWVYFSPEVQRWRILVRWAFLFLILFFFHGARMVAMDPEARIINDYFTLCNDFFLCDRYQLDGIEQKQFGLFLDYWMVPDHSRAEVAQLSKWVNSSKVSFEYLFSPIRWSRIDENYFGKQWVLSTLFVSTFLFGVISIFQFRKPWGVVRVIIALLPIFIIYSLRPYSFWLLAIISGIICLHMANQPDGGREIGKWPSLLVFVALLLSLAVTNQDKFLDQSREDFIENWSSQKYNGNLIVDLSFLFAYSMKSPANEYPEITHKPTQRVFCYYYLPALTEGFQEDVQAAGGFVRWIQMQSQLHTPFIGGPTLRSSTLAFLASRDTQNIYWFEPAEAKPILNAQASWITIQLESHLLKFRPKQQSTYSRFIPLQEMRK